MLEKFLLSQLLRQNKLLSIPLNRRKSSYKNRHSGPYKQSYVCGPGDTPLIGKSYGKAPNSVDDGLISSQESLAYIILSYCNSYYIAFIFHDMDTAT